MQTYMHRINEQCDFFKTISEVLKSSFTISDYSVIIGGDFNASFDQELDGGGGLKKKKDSVRVLEDIFLDHDLSGVAGIPKRNVLLVVKNLQLFRDA